jgi:hypothetical protein
VSFHWTAFGITCCPWHGCIWAIALVLEAHRKRAHFRGTGRMAFWQRQMLAFSIADAHRALWRAKRDIARVRSLEAAWNDSSLKLENLLAAPDSTPSHQASRQKQLVRSWGQAIQVASCGSHSVGMRSPRVAGLEFIIAGR